MPPRLFTLEEATALLPALSELITRLQARKAELDYVSEQLDMLLERSQGNGHVETPQMESARRETQQAARDVETMLQRIDKMGCELKGLEEGLVDFPSLRGERIVYLCWRLGEDGIRFWHELDTGFAGRQPL